MVPYCVAVLSGLPTLCGVMLFVGGREEGGGNWRC